MEVEVVQCAVCGNGFERKIGRGRKSDLCEACRTRRNRHRAFVRQFQVWSTTIEELAELVGPTLSDMRQEVKERQDGRCNRCGRKGRLFLWSPDGAGAPVGLCMTCWRARGDEDDADRRSEEGPEGVPGGGRGRQRSAAD